MAPIVNASEAVERGLLSGASCAFGVFDGVHLGHRFLIDQAIETARKSGGAAVALTFDVDPDELFHADRLKKLMGNERRLRALAETGADYVVVLTFTEDFAAQAPAEFLEATFGGCVPYALHVGADFRFGARAAGTVADLEAWASAGGTRICAHELKGADGRPIRATRIRLLLAEGRCEDAVALLGHPYVFDGEVRKGRGEGADMGFRTANLELPAMLQTLGEGVYAAWATVDGARYRAAMSVGAAPTFEAATATCEVNILDFSGDIYGDSIEVEPVRFLRPMIRFSSVDELIATVKGNIAWVRENLVRDSFDDADERKS